jgi:phage-related protein (TIGR01555 family)
MTDQTKTDGAYANVFLNVGNSRDRSSFSGPNLTARSLGMSELDSLYVNDGFAARIIDTHADEMVRRGFEVEGVDDDAVMAALEGLKLDQALGNALKWADLYGGSLVVMLINDGQDFTQPLNPENAKEIEQLRVYDRWQVSRHAKYTDPMDKRFGQTQIYMISPLTGAPYYVHESRCMVFDGANVPDRVREQNDGWGGSVLQKCYDQLVRLNMAHIWANALMERAQQAVHGIPGLTNILRAPGGEALVRQRIDLVDMARGINNTVVIDGEESYDLKSTALTSVPDLMDRQADALCAVTGMPKSLLIGQQTGSLNSGSSDLENWYARIGQRQRQALAAPVDRIVGIVLRQLGLYTPDYRIKFCPLWVPSEKDRAATDKTEAETAKIYHDMGALDASEIRMGLEHKYHIDPVEQVIGEEDPTEPA